MPPDNGRNRAPQILGRGLALGAARLDQRLQAHPLRVHEHGSSSSRRGKTLVIRTGSSSNRPNLQAAIEAIDRAIKDEEQLPPDYAQEEPVTASEASVAEGSNVVDVDFDPA